MQFSAVARRMVAAGTLTALITLAAPGCKSGGTSSGTDMSPPPAKAKMMGGTPVGKEFVQKQEGQQAPPMKTKTTETTNP